MLSGVIILNTKEVAHKIIDMVEHDIRRVHPEVDQIAMEFTVNDEKPNTLLYGETYYNLEDAIVQLLDAQNKR